LTPEAYTGRAGIPDFQDLGRLAILRISSRDGQEADAGKFVIHPEEGLACYRRLSVGRYACPTGAGEQRSQITPVWLKNTQSSACGLLEDTRKAKRLIGDDGRELLSAHLSCFAYSSISAGVELVRVAVREARRLGLPALFLSVVESEAPALRASLPDFEVLEATAVVYGTGLMAAHWNINSSEI
jgi:hypothetical protein